VQAGIAAFTDEEEAGLHAVIVEARVVEITEHRLVGRMIPFKRPSSMSSAMLAGVGERRKMAKQPLQSRFFRGNRPWIRCGFKPISRGTSRSRSEVGLEAQRWLREKESKTPMRKHFLR
jgi:hypothetical protein